MNKLKSIISIMTAAISLTIIMGCAANWPLLRPNQDSRREYVNTHPQLSEEIKQAILDGKAIKGMSKDDVEASWGEPTSTKDFSTNPNAWWYDKEGEGWWYKPFFLSFEPSIFVKFRKGIVDYTRDDYK